MHAAGVDANLKAHGLYIPGSAAERFGWPFSERAAGRSLKVAAFIRYKQKPVIYSTYHSEEQSHAVVNEPQITCNGQLAVGFTSAEFSAMLGMYMDTCTSRRKPTVVICDGDRTHTASATANKARQLGIELLLMPPRSHDLSPLDSFYFAEAKRRWRRRLFKAKPRPKWEAMVQWFLQELEATDSDVYIKDYQDKLKACSKAGGQRFQEQLDDIRAQRHKKKRAKVHKRGR